MRKTKDPIDAFFEKLEAEDPKYAAYSERFDALSNFLFDYHLLKGTDEYSYADVAAKAKVSKRAILRLEEMKHPPKYDLLVKVSKALGDSLFMSPMASMSITLQLDLHEKAKFLSEKLDKDITDLMYEHVRAGIEKAYEELQHELKQDLHSDLEEKNNTGEEIQTAI